MSILVKSTEPSRLGNLSTTVQVKQMDTKDPNVVRDWRKNLQRYGYTPGAAVLPNGLPTLVWYKTQPNNRLSRIIEYNYAPEFIGPSNPRNIRTQLLVLDADNSGHVNAVYETELKLPSSTAIYGNT